MSKHLAPGAERPNESEAGLARALLELVAHELRSPLWTLTTSVTMLRRSDRLTARQRRLLALADESAQRVDRIARDLLDHARLESGRLLPLARRSADLSAICEAAVWQVEEHCRGARPVDYAFEGDARGEWDPDRLTQAILYVLEHAIESAPAAPIRLRWEGKPVEISVRVEVERPIHPGDPPIDFFGLEWQPEVPRRSQGLDLRLLIARGIVISHGGTMARVRTNAGVTFVLEVPRHGPEERSPEVRTLEVEPASRRPASGGGTP